jgi:hypothetical protein
MIVYMEVLAIWFVIATLVHWLVAIYSRSVRRERLEKEFDAGGVDGARDDYISTGMRDYEHGLRRRLIGVIWVLPVVAFIGVSYWVNYH